MRLFLIMLLCNITIGCYENKSDQNESDWRDEYGILENTGAIAGKVPVWGPSSAMMYLELYQYGRDIIIASGNVIENQHGTVLILNIPPGIYTMHIYNNNDKEKRWATYNNIEVKADSMNIITIQTVQLGTIIDQRIEPSTPLDTVMSIPLDSAFLINIPLDSAFLEVQYTGFFGQRMTPPGLPFIDHRDPATVWMDERMIKTFYGGSVIYVK